VLDYYSNKQKKNVSKSIIKVCQSMNKLDHFIAAFCLYGIMVHSRDVKKPYLKEKSVKVQSLLRYLENGRV